MGDKKVDIGVLEERSSFLLHPRFFPSKVGGKPAWLDLKNLPSPSETTCSRCEDPLIFLCQVRTEILFIKMIQFYNLSMFTVHL